MSDWFDAPGRGERGLRFRCTMCGQCCTGPEGYVLFTDAEAEAIAARLGISRAEFDRVYTRPTSLGPSLQEVPSEHGLDCVFLDRRSVPGRAICRVYEARPAQCRAWPFWKSVLATPESWRLASRTCPGIGQGPLIPPEQIRIMRDG